MVNSVVAQEETDHGGRWRKLRWTSGQNSALDIREIFEGRDVGNETATKIVPDGPVDVPYFVDFTFAYHVSFPDRKIHVE